MKNIDLDTALLVAAIILLVTCLIVKNEKLKEWAVNLGVVCVLSAFVVMAYRQIF